MIAADWAQLAEEWEGSAVGLVAEVDCSGAGKEVCKANGVHAYPKLKYGAPSALVEYRGKRAYNEFAQFAQDHLKPADEVTSRRQHKLRHS
jgi:hypothetical protein